MKILLLSHYYAPDSGAAANRLTRLATQLQARGHQVTVLTTMPHYPQGVIPKQYKRRLVVTEERDGVRVIQVWLYTSPDQRIAKRLLSQISFMVTCTLRGLLIRRHDVMLIENQPIFTAFAGWIISRLKRMPYVANISDFWPEYLVVAGITTEESLTYRVFKALANRTQRGASGLVVLYEPLLRKIEERIGTVDNSAIIYNAVDFDTFNADVDDQPFREKYNLGNARLITFLGVFGSHIDLDTMLTVAKHFRDYPDLKFLFIGSGQQKEKLNAQLQDEQFAHCQAIDWIDYEEVPAFWSASSITYWAVHDNPLDQMRFQAKLYEALATGTPAVIAVNGLMQSILTTSNTGITVPPGDSEAMIQAIDRLLNDTTYYRAISTQARQYAEANYSIKRHVDDYEAMLESIKRT